MARILLYKAFRPLEYYTVTQPLGLMYLASTLRQHGHEVAIVDMIADVLSPEDAVERAKPFAPDLVGIHAMTHEAPTMHTLARLLKGWRSDLPVAAGGPHPSTDPHETLRNEAIDALCIGEGEDTAPEMFRHMLAGESPVGVLGTAYRKDGEVVIEPPRPPILDLDRIPFPAWDLIDVPRYFDLPKFSTVCKRKQYMSIFTSRGCPYSCTYCHTIFTKKFRTRSVDNVIAELRTLHDQWGIRELHIIDDIFNCQMDHAKKICDRIVEEKLDFAITFPNGVRGDLMDKELLQKLSKAGCYRITYAIETASPRLQKVIKKHNKLDKLRQVIEWTDEMNILQNGFFMLGFPGETREEINTTIKYALDSKLHTAQFFVVNPFEGTELTEQARALGKDFSTDPEIFSYFRAENTLCEVPPAELNAMQRGANRRFYLNPRRAIRFITLYPQRSQLVGLFFIWLVLSFKVFSDSHEKHKWTSLFRSFRFFRRQKELTSAAAPA